MYGGLASSTELFLEELTTKQGLGHEMNEFPNFPQLSGELFIKIYSNMNSHFQNLNILIISPEPWDHLFVSKHHYAIHLAKRGNKVYFLNPPIDKIKVAVSNTEFENLYSISYKPFFRGLRFLPSAFSRFLETEQKNILEKVCGVKFDIIWNFETSRFFNLDIWNRTVIKILHIVDLNQDFQTKRAASTADICFCTSDFIKQKLSLFNNNAFKIQHGYNIPKKIKPKKLKGIIKAGYVGSLHMPYFDWAVTLKIVEQNPMVDFYFIGPLEPENLNPFILNIIKILKDTDHVHFIGAISAFDIPNYLAAMDMHLIIYKAEEFKEQLASPHKMMDYLGSGKMIVATFTAEYSFLEQEKLIAMCLKNTDFPALFKEVLSDLERWNAEEKKSARIAFAFENTYENQIKRIENKLFKI